MSSNDVKLGTRAEPIAAPVSDARFDTMGRVEIVRTTTARPRFTRFQLIVAFVLFNIAVWSTLIWIVFR